MRPTIKDIAERAGVSKTTVSFALNTPDRISEKTYRRVMAIVDELGYVPDPVARTLTTKKLGALGLLLPQPITEALRNPYLCEMIRGVGEICERGEFSLVMLPPVRGRILEAARRAFVDGLITIGVGPDHEVVELLHRRHVPFVTIDGEDSASTVNVGVDDEDAAYTLMRHILALGHRRIAILALPPETVNQPGAGYSLVRDRRLAGFGRALGEAGLLPGSPRVRILPAEVSYEGGAATAEGLLGDRASAPTAIVAMADIVALGVHESCRRAGFRIPEDISVAGFDDIPDSVRAIPPLTTVRQPGRGKGAMAASLVVSILSGESVAHTRLGTELMVRGSVAAACGSTAAVDGGASTERD